MTTANLPYFGGAAAVQEYPTSNALGLDAVAGYAFTSRLELEGRFGYMSASPDQGDGTSGFTDLLMTGHYLFRDVPVSEAGDVIDVAVGGYADVPVGQDEVGGGTFDFGVYGALRHGLNDRVVLTGNAGIDFVETPSSFTPGFCVAAIYLPVCTTGEISGGGRQTSISLGAGAIRRVAEALHFVGELRIESEFDYAALSGGVDYTAALGHLRAALLVGLDDGAPDVGIVAQLLRSF